MTRVALTLAFDGTRYCGWQAQKNGLSVQTAVCEAAAKVYGAPVPVTGCSRTDAGVHACGFVCHMDVPFVIPPDALPLALNRALPPDIAVRAACETDGTFHARYSAAGKEYVYRIRNSRLRDPFENGRALLWPHPLDAAALDERSAGLMMLLSSAGIAAGYLLNGVTADFCSRWKWMTWERLYACTGVLFSALMGGLVLFGGRAAPLWCPVMFLSTMSMISFPIIGRLFAVEETGRVFSLLNFIIFAASFLMQWLVGVILNFYPVAGGHFSPDGYRAALLAVFAVNAAAALHLCVYLPKIEKLRKF